MPSRYRIWLGMGGVPPHDHPAAYHWERRLHWLMIAAALLAAPAFYFEAVASEPGLKHLGRILNFFIFLIFSAELGWMLRVTAQKRLYLARNWLDVLIVASTAASLAGWNGEWLPLARLLRLAIVTLLIARVVGSLRSLTPGSTPYIVALGAVALALAGGGFYWLEPTVDSYVDGLWLAFTSGATVGYGDIVPTTLPARIFAAIMVVLGYAILSLVTASIAAFFIGKDELRLRHEMHSDIKALRHELAQLREELHQGTDKRGQSGQS